MLQVQEHEGEFEALHRRIGKLQAELTWLAESSTDLLTQYAQRCQYLALSHGLHADTVQDWGVTGVSNCASGIGAAWIVDGGCTKLVRKPWANH